MVILIFVESILAFSDTDYHEICQK